MTQAQQSGAGFLLLRFFLPVRRSSSARGASSRALRGGIRLRSSPQTACCPIICEGDAVGAVAIIGKDIKNPISVTEQKLAAVAANFLGKQMES